MRPDSERWVEVSPSEYPHERAGLEQVREALPDADPYRAWSNLEVITDRGQCLEVDLLVLGPAGLYLVELKGWEGRVSGDRYTWWVQAPGGRRLVVDNPLPAAARKARVLHTLLLNAYERITAKAPAAKPRASQLVPWIEAAVFLSGPGVVCDLAPQDRVGVYGPEGVPSTGLPGLVSALLTREPQDPRQRVDAKRSKLLGGLLRKAGMGRRTRREVGTYVLAERSFDTGPFWQDFLAVHRRFGDERRRVRIYNVGTATTTEGRQVLVRAAEREYRLLRHVQHPSLLVPREYHDTRFGPALVYDFDERAVRLDHFLARAERLSFASRLAMVRGLAEALRYAHGRHVTHRGLSPRSVLVGGGEREPEVQIADWQTGADLAVTSPSSVVAGTSHVDVLTDSLMEAYQAPETQIQPHADEVRLDVFSLGALAYLILTGRPPALDAVALRERVQRDGGLDLAADVEAVPERLRRLVLDATRGAVSERLPDVDAFLRGLAEVEAEAREPEPAPEVDPLEAQAETVLAGRWRVLRRLGGGASAIAFLVEDTAHDDAVRVLKVARDAEKAARLRDEADALRGLDDPRIARLIEGPIVIGERTALLLEHAGDLTLAEELRRAGRLSLDRLERYGDDLLGVVAYLHSAGVDHRDIKPANLGVRERPSDRQKHLVLFDFSLSRASTADIRAGTPPYLDPFLGSGNRHRWDAAAERYAAAVTLFEAATGRTPEYGDGRSDPLVVDAEATVEPALFDPAVAEPLAAFFRRALRRDARERFDTAEDMLRAWHEVFRAAGRPAAEPDRLAARAGQRTPLAESGLSPRAVSALEPLGVATVGELLTVPPARLTRLAGANESTRREIRARVREWRQRLAKPAPPGPVPVSAEPPARSVDAVIDQLLPRLQGENATTVKAARLLLGRPADPGGEVPPPWPTQRELAEQLGVTAARVQQIDAKLRRRWSRNGGNPLAGVRDDLVAIVRAHGGVATADEVAAALLARRGSIAQGALLTSQALGLVRAAVEAELEQGGVARLDRRRRGTTVLIAIEPADGDRQPSAARRMDYVLALGDAAARLVREPDTPVPAGAALEQLRAVGSPEGMVPLEDGRLLRLAAAASGEVAVSARDELYRRGMPAEAALRHSGAAFGTGAAVLSVEVLRERVRARFPEAEPLPGRPELDELLQAVGSPLEWDAAQQGYRARTVREHSIGPRPSTSLGEVDPARLTVEELDRRLRDALEERAFLVLGALPRQLDRATRLLAERYGVEVLDLAAALIERMRALADEHGLPWRTVLEADAAERHSYEGEGLRNLVARAVAEVAERLRRGGRPLLLTDPGLLARYGHLDLLARLADHTTRRERATWLLVPTLEGQTAPTVNGRPVPIVSPAQWLRIPRPWYQEPAVPAGGEGVA